MANGLGAPTLLLVALALAAPAALGSTGGEPLLDAEGNLTAGTAGVVVGDPDDALPGQTDAFDPISHAAHGFTVPDCTDSLGVRSETRTLGIDPETWQSAELFDPGLVRLEVRGPDGATLESEFGNAPSFIVDGPLPAGSYALHIFHMVGAPIEYTVTVDAGTLPSCG